MNKKTRIFNSLGVIITRVFGALAGFLLNALITNSLSKSDAGSFFVMLATYMTFVIICSLGLENYILRKVSPIYNDGDMEGASLITSNVISLAVIVSSVLVTLVILTKNNFLSVLFSLTEQRESFVYLVISLPFAVANYLFLFLFQSVGRPYIGVILCNIVQPALFSILFFISQEGGSLITTNYSISVLIVSLICICAWLFKVRVRFVIPSLFGLRDTFFLTRTFFLIALLGLCFTHIPVAISGLFIPTDQIAGFSVSMKIASIITMVFVSINSIYAPKFSTLYSNGDYSGILSQASKASILMAVISLPALGLMFIFPTLFLDLFGSDYKQHELTLRILVVSQFIMAVTGPYGYVLNMTDNQRVFLLIQCVSILVLPIALGVGILFNIFEGANLIAISVSMSICCRNLLCKFVAERKVICHA